MTNQEYILLHRNDDTRSLALNPGKADDVDLPFALNQIAGWQTARKKLPSWAANSDVIYPPHLSMEQCSSEATAHYKATVAERLIKTAAEKGGEKRETVLVDLTGGLGVDFTFTAPAFTQAVYVERQDCLCRLAWHNFSVLGISHAEVINAQCEDYIAEMSYATMIFADPARRDEYGGRTYSVSDCTPDVLALKDLLLDKADYVMLKLSPMLDVKKTVSDFGQSVGEVHIVSVGGECKELLLILSRRYEGLERIFCVDDGKVFEYSPNDFVVVSCSSSPSILPELTASTDLLYLHEPNASVMKAGCFGEISRAFSVDAVSVSSHLFISYKPIAGFPGRSFIVRKAATMNRRQLKSALQGVSQANITVRNFPLSVAELRRRLKLKDGGSTYIFATTMADGTHTLLICEKA